MNDSHGRPTSEFGCSKCQGTGQIVEIIEPHPTHPLYRVTPCDHLRRVDVTGPTDDEIRIGKLEDELRDLRAAAFRVVAEIDECKALLESVGCERVIGTPLIAMVREVVAMVKS